MELLRFCTAGSVDDGKSSLIGRLLYDSKSIFEDQLAEVQRASARRGDGQMELALLTDGLRAEREQNITIDVAYRYFGTPRRKFIVADAPGHVQYTRNLVTAASTASLAVVLLDARKGVLCQSKRHAAVAILLGVKSISVAVNKMDLVGFSQLRFEEIVAECRQALVKLGAERVDFFPISALHGDNVVTRSERTPWYEGPALLEHLETVEIPCPVTTEGLRFPVQTVIRAEGEYRGLAGQVESGVITAGSRVLVLPSGQEATVRSLRSANGECASVTAGHPATVELDCHMDVSRGAMLVAPDAPPTITERFSATVCWMGDEAIAAGQRLILIHGGRRVPVFVEEVLDLLDIETLETRTADDLETNDIGRVLLHTAEPLWSDPYASNAITGSFVLVDSGSYRTVGAGMIGESAVHTSRDRQTPLIAWVANQDEGLEAALVDEARARGFAVLHLSAAEVAAINQDSPDDAEACRRLLQFARIARAQGLAVVIHHPSQPKEEGLFVITGGSPVPHLADALYGRSH